MKNYYIGQSKIHGKGTFANRSFKKGDLIGIALIQIKYSGIPAQDLIRTNLGRYINHSELGNVELEQRERFMILKSNKDIEKDEEIIIDYGKNLAFEISGGFQEKDLNEY
jgi:SET domain-containing protein